MSEGNGTTISLFGGFWTSGWLFTWAYLGLTGWNIIGAIFIWAYYLGEHFKGVAC